MLSELKAERDEINNRLLELRMAENDYKKECANKEAVITRISNTRKAQEIAQEVAQFIQQQVHSHIAGIVTRCLATVFTENPYEFRLIFEKKRGKTECRLAFFRDGIERNPMEETGGGAVDIAAFALRLAGIILAKPPLRRLLVLDEPFKCISVEYRERLRGLLEALSEEMGVEIIMVTHMKALQVGNVVDLGA